jgi:acetoacetyl-CoA synthetase
VIYGRSDATLNREGVRVGTSELYRVVDALPEIHESLVVDTGELGVDGELVLFVVLDEGHDLDEALRARLKDEIRTQLSPRHVPNEIIPVPDIPKTLSGKRLEVPVKRILLGENAEDVASPDALANPEALRAFAEFSRERRKR